jgi:hypothetical protein
MRSWHDYRLVGYSVDGERGEVSFQLIWTEPTPAEVKSAQLLFSGVLDYFLQGDLGTNIVAAIAEAPIEPFVRENAHSFKEEQKFGWPRSWKGSTEETVQYLKQSRARLWTLSSSYGLAGWILGTGVTERAKAA